MLFIFQPILQFQPAFKRVMDFSRRPARPGEAQSVDLVISSTELPVVKYNQTSPVEGRGEKLP